MTAPSALRSLLLLVSGSAICLAQPSVTAVQNAASNIPAGLPNSGVAQGAQFVVKGANLGPATYVVASKFPLETSIAGTSIQVSVGGRSIAAIMYYAGPTQASAILPSTTPTGAGTLTVTVNGQTSAPAPILVVQNAIGVYTANSSGSGDAVASMGSTFLAPGNAANPGDTVVLWATGLGPVTFDEANAAQQSDMTSVPVEAFVGGRTANVVFRGRNGCCSSVDTIYVQVPQGVAGCAVPVVFKIGSIVSNTTTIPVAASGRLCTPTTPGITQTDLTQLFSKPTITYGGVNLSRSVTITQPTTVGGFTIPGTTSKVDIGGASFFKLTVPPGGYGLSSSVDVATFGSCTVTSFVAAQSSIPTIATQFLDAGASLGVSGPGGSKSLPKMSIGNAIVYSGTLDAAANYLNAGQYTVTGPGGADIGSFSAQLTVPQPLTWTNQTSITTVNRANGVTVNWTGGDPAGYVQITGSSFVGTSLANSVSVSFACTAKTTDGTFTVPSIVLLALPPSASIGAGGTSIPVAGTLGVSSFSTTTRFQATGLDYGGISTYSSNNISAVYQ